MTAPELLSAPTAVACPNCGAPQGYPCSQPTDTGRRVVRWTHLARDAEFDKANERIKREHAEYERELELSQVGAESVVGSQVIGHGPTPYRTVGNIAAELRRMQADGVTRQSIEYALGKVYA